MVAFNLCYYQARSHLLGTIRAFKHQDLQMFGRNLSKCEYYIHALDVVSRYRDPQLQISGKLNFECSTLRVNHLLKNVNLSSFTLSCDKFAIAILTSRRIKRDILTL